MIAEKDFRICAIRTRKKPFYALNETLYGDREIVDLAGRFDISIPVDVFDEVKIFLLDCERRNSRLLYSQGGGRVEERALATGEFDRVLKRCYEELNQLYEGATKS